MYQFEVSAWYLLQLFFCKKKTILYNTYWSATLIIDSQHMLVFCSLRMLIHQYSFLWWPLQTQFLKNFLALLTVDHLWIQITGTNDFFAAPRTNFLHPSVLSSTTNCAWVLRPIVIIWLAGLTWVYSTISLTYFALTLSFSWLARFTLFSFLPNKFCPPLIGPLYRILNVTNMKLVLEKE